MEEGGEVENMCEGREWLGLTSGVCCLGKSHSEAGCHGNKQNIKTMCKRSRLEIIEIP